jgi:hypothetical protein
MASEATNLDTVYVAATTGVVGRGVVAISGT